MTAIIRPSVETVTTIHSELIRHIGGIHGIRELANLGWGLAEDSITKAELVEWIISHS